MIKKLNFHLKIMIYFTNEITLLFHIMTVCVLTEKLQVLKPTRLVIVFSAPQKFI